MRKDQLLLALQTWVVVAFAAGAFGGRVGWAPPWIASLCFAAVVPLILWWRASEQPAKTLWRRGWYFLPWLGLGALVAGSLWNPLYAYETLADGSRQLVLLDSAILWLPGTADPALTRQSLMLGSGLLWQGFVLAVALDSRRGQRLLLNGLVVIVFVLAVVGTVFHLLGASEILGLYEPPAGYFFATFVYKNHWVAFALLGMVLAIGFFWHEWEKGGLARLTRGSPLGWYLLAFLVIGLTLPMPHSRTGAILLTVVLLVFVWKAVRLPGTKAEKRFHRYAVSGLLVLSGLLATGVWVFSEDRLREGMDRSERQWERFQESGQWESRGYLFRDTAEMARTRPLWGWGAGNFRVVFPAFKSEQVRGQAIDAHTDWMQFWSELGLVGVLLLLIPLLFRARILWRDPLCSRRSRWILFGAGLLLLMAMGEFPLQNPAVALLLVVLLCVGNAARRDSGASGKLDRKPLEASSRKRVRGTASPIG